MRQHLDAQIVASDVASVEDRPARSAGTVLGWYVTDHGRRHLRAIETRDCGLCLIDEGSEASFLVEPLLEGMSEARAIAADYLALASEQREPQTRHPWPRAEDSQIGSRS